MNVITNTMRALVRRRLWPVALLLVAALVAVPMKLAKTPAAAPVVSAATTAKAAQAKSIARPIVELRGTTAGDKRRRRVLGAAKDPFEPAPLPKAKKSKKAKKAEATPTPAPTPDAPAGGSGGSSGPPAAAPTPAPAPTVTIAKGSIKVRFGVPSDATDLPQLLIGHLEALPSSDAPVLVLERFKDSGRTAVFSIPGDITAVGDGKCQPTPEDCTSLELRAGQTEFVTVKGAADNGADVQYELDLMKIFTKATKVPKDSLPAAAGGPA